MDDTALPLVYFNYHFDALLCGKNRFDVHEGFFFKVGVDTNGINKP